MKLKSKVAKKRLGQTETWKPGESFCFYLKIHCVEGPGDFKWWVTTLPAHYTRAALATSGRMTGQGAEKNRHKRTR